MEAAARVFEHDRNRLVDLINEIRLYDNPPMVAPVRARFCRCNMCQEMPTKAENRCCRQVLCRSTTAVFTNICLDKENVQTSIRNLSDSFVFTPMYENNAMRHAAYRQYIMWQHGHVGAKKRIVIPSCCVLEIRRAYPSPQNKYTGFIPSKRLTINP